MANVQANHAVTCYASTLWNTVTSFYSKLASFDLSNHCNGHFVSFFPFCSAFVAWIVSTFFHFVSFNKALGSFNARVVW